MRATQRAIAALLFCATRSEALAAVAVLAPIWVGLGPALLWVIVPMTSTFGRKQSPPTPFSCRGRNEAKRCNEIIYLIGLVVVVMFVLSLLGLR